MISTTSLTNVSTTVRAETQNKKFLTRALKRFMVNCRCFGSFISIRPQGSHLAGGSFGWNVMVSFKTLHLIVMLPTQPGRLILPVHRARITTPCQASSFSSAATSSAG